MSNKKQFFKNVWASLNDKIRTWICNSFWIEIVEVEILPLQIRTYIFFLRIIPYKKNIAQLWSCKKMTFFSIQHLCLMTKHCESLAIIHQWNSRPRSTQYKVRKGTKQIIYFILALPFFHLFTQSLQIALFLPTNGYFWTIKMMVFHHYVSIP